MEATMRVIHVRLLISGALIAALLVIGGFGSVANDMPNGAALAIDAGR
jgi:hypothetical protein